MGVSLAFANIINSVNLSNNENFISWKESDLTKFSNSKMLFNYQTQSLENLLKAIYLFNKEGKEGLYEKYKALIGEKYFNISEANTLKESGFNIENSKISLSELSNRASVWMATGSGKTVVIIKLIELLIELMS
ncbi:MAG: DEAD/DEAH box helicase family protein, partial [Candidatus Calescibacterium sp.]|nr:DEAD/DEAH box helicase family protein [Candidatus Calescibacterium sp.]